MVYNVKLIVCTISIEYYPHLLVSSLIWSVIVVVFSSSVLLIWQGFLSPYVSGLLAYLYKMIHSWLIRYQFNIFDVILIFL